MQKINFSLIKEIQDKADIVRVISSFIKLSPKGNNYFGLCPFHADKTPSLVVSPKKKIFKCFVCGAKGNVFGFVQQYKKVPFLEAVHIVAQLINFDDSQLQVSGSNTYLDPKVKRLFDANKQANEWYQGFLYNRENSNQLDYLTKRGLSLDIIKEFEFGYAPNGKDQIYRMLSNADGMFGTSRSKDIVWSEKELLDAGLITMTAEGQVYDFFNDRIIIPIYDNNGYLAAFSGRTTRNVDPKYLNTSTTAIFSKANTLFNFYKAKQVTTDKIIIVEGFMDTIAYIRAGHRNVIATMGVALSSEHLNALHTIPKLETVILSFDNDTAGVAATIEHGRKLMESGFNVFVAGPFDKKYKDVDELINASGNITINDILDNRIDFITFLINNAFDTKKPADEVQKSVNSVIQYMIDCADSSILLRTQHLKLLAAKSNFEYEDLRDKFNHDLEKALSAPTKESIHSQETLKYKPSKPSNEMGLKETFIEKEEDKQVNKEINHPQLDDLYHQGKIQIKRITEGYDNLIKVLIANPEQIGIVLNELFIENEFNIDEQRFILKSIVVLHNRGLQTNRETLLKYIDEQSKKESGVAKNYKRAHAYLQNLLEDSTYKVLGKIAKDRKNERIKELLHLIQTSKYHLLITNKMIRVWELTKENQNLNRSQIDKLQVQIKDYHRLLKKLDSKFV